MEIITPKRNNELTELITNLAREEVHLGLERIKGALKAMGNPCKEIPAIQIVGTNGKGSIASFLQSCLKYSGIRAGVTTSPHLVSWCERICTDGELISHGEFRKRLISLKPIARNYKLSAFELVIAAAFDHFAEQKVEILVLEVGLGGRLDATSAHSSRPVIAFGSIGLDHCEYLGKNLKEITQEKAAVINPGSIVISAKQHPEVTKVLKDAAQKKQAKLKWVNPLPKDWILGLKGDIQRENAAVAKGVLEALSCIGWNFDEKKVQEGLTLAKWPGRLQKTSWHKLPLIVDGAHNPPAAEQLAKERNSWENQENGIHWILGIQANKDAPTIIRYLLKPNDFAWIVSVPNCLSWNKIQLLKICPELSGQILSADNAQQVLYRLMQKGWPVPPPVVTGSLYLIGDLIDKEILTLR